ncbi:efflux RND transporter periplasmic adaptor subunit [Polycladidibacter hongkongensis]|uniref:efflux RND transporter periplasmic adaptor subunit n=1 Tax=Polycladidibacter hongkongensis TaxID=1647556 RepID=UPI00082A18C3|nr:HlyD family efflux transporter periplasmic adaptor subunit [Pseudovibrio hongkongensis]
MVSKGKLIGGGVAAVALTAFVWAIQPQPVLVEEALVSQGPLSLSIEGDGQTRVQEVYRIFSPVAGRVSRSLLDVGDVTIAGETVIVRIMPQDPPFMDVRDKAKADARVLMAQANLQVSEAALDAARSAAKLARNDLERAKKLARSATISDAQLERASVDVDLKEAEIVRAQATVALRHSELDSAEADLIEPKGYVDPERAAELGFPMISPINGAVLKLAVESEQSVPAGALLVEVGDPDRLEVVVDLLSLDAVQVRQGAKATLSAWGGPPLSAVVRRVEPAGFTKVSALGIEEQRVNVVLDLVAPDARLGHGYEVRAHIDVWSADDVVQVPMSALFRYEDSWAAYVNEEGSARLRLLSVGKQNKDAAQVLEGLQKGERVILFPSDKLADGVAVAPLVKDK